MNIYAAGKQNYRLTEQNMFVDLIVYLNVCLFVYRSRHVDLAVEEPSRLREPELETAKQQQQQTEEALHFTALINRSICTNKIPFAERDRLEDHISGVFTSLIRRETKCLLKHTVVLGIKRILRRKFQSFYRDSCLLSTLAV
jgi:hypothetical protein